MGYDCIVIDPPWPQRKGGKRSTRPRQGRILDYDVMPLHTLFAHTEDNILNALNPNGVVFLWSIDKFLTEADKWMVNLGFRRHARLVWDKRNGVAPAFSLRFTHEYVTWWYKGRFTSVSAEQRGKFTTVFHEPPREHSRKPDYLYSMIDALYPSMSKLDAYSREPREGWDQYGDETDFFGSD